ncbi:MAG: hypothetical protein L0J09_06425 [Lactococcus lactis]|nr:hypothetical protein [Lactococcus lactis]
MYGYIYRTTNLINNKIYIGQKKSNIFVPTYYGSGTIIKRAISKYGIENFEVKIIEQCFSKEQLCEREIFWIAKEKSLYSFGKGYNITPGGEFGDTFSHHPDKEEIRKRMSITNAGRKHSDDWKRKASERTRGKNNPMYGKPGTRKGLSMSSEQKEKIRQSNIGKKRSVETIQKVKDAKKNRTKEKIAEASKNHSEAMKKRIARDGHSMQKKVYVYDNLNNLVNTFKSVKECKEYYFEKYKLSKKTIQFNLQDNKPICPEIKKGIRKDLYEIRLKFKGYEFTHTKR